MKTRFLGHLQQGLENSVLDCTSVLFMKPQLQCRRLTVFSISATEHENDQT